MPLLSPTRRRTQCWQCLLLVLLMIPHGGTVDTPEVALLGLAPNENYIKVPSTHSYELACSFRAGYDDKVITVTWIRHGQQVYEWNEQYDTITVSPQMQGLVNPSPSRDPQNMHIRHPDLSLSGAYSCQVRSTKETVFSKTLHVFVIDVDSDQFETHVDVLSDLQNHTEASDEETDLVKPSVTADPWHPPLPPPPEPSCVLVWGFSTPAISPRPNITCGYYSYSHDAITQVVPGGMQLHQLPSGAWQAEILGTQIPVSNIPLNGRLGCSITIPHTTYSKMVKFEDGLVVDNLIDEVGCPGLDELVDLYGLQLRVEGATTTCRGDHLPSSSSEPAVATVSCPSGAMFRDGRVEADWQLMLTCIDTDLRWRLTERSRSGRQEPPPPNGEDGTAEDPALQDPSLDDEAMDPMMNSRELPQGQAFNPQTFPWPVCVGGSSSGSAAVHQRPSVSHALWLAVMTSLLVYHCNKPCNS